MPSLEAIVASSASTLIRLFAYIFLRWIPGHPFPPLIFTLATIYLVSFVTCLLKNDTHEVTVEAIHVTVPQPLRRVRFAASHHGPVANSDLDEVTDVDATLLLHDKPQDVIRTILTGRPSSSSRAWSLVTFLINVLLVCFIADATFRAAWYHASNDLSLSRVGYVSHNDVRILVREPNNTHYPIQLSYRYAGRPGSDGHRPFDFAWRPAGAMSELTEATDYTTTFTIANLRPSTRYQYALSNDHNGYFVTAPRPGDRSSRASSVDASSLTFVHSSCILANFPYSPTSHPLSMPGFKSLAAWLSSIRPSFMLFLGDFIYIDVPRRHGSSVEDYRRAYRQIYASPDWPSVSQVRESPGEASYSLPWLHVYDDHEIANDWNKNTSGYFPAAFDPYVHYHVAPNPPLALGDPIHALKTSSAARSALNPQDLAKGSAPTWTKFVQGPAAFFMLDTRRYRGPPNISNPWDPNASVLGQSQFDALSAWLREPAATGVHWRIVVSSVPFTKNWRVNAHDTWSGYLFERRRILELMWKSKASTGIGIVVLSGDRHEFAATSFTPPRTWSGAAELEGLDPTIHEFSTSPLSMFYLPFRTYQEDKAASRPFWRHLSWFPSLLPAWLGSSTADTEVQPTADELPVGGVPVARADCARESTRKEGQLSDADTEHDTAISYLPAGNSKFGIVSIETPTASGQSILRYRVVIDGVEVWSHVLVSTARTGGTVLDEGTWH